MFGPCFVVHHLVPFLVLRSSCWERERDGNFTLVVF